MMNGVSHGAPNFLVAASCPDTGGSLEKTGTVSLRFGNGRKSPDPADSSPVSVRHPKPRHRRDEPLQKHTGPTPIRPVHTLRSVAHTMPPCFNHAKGCKLQG